jgi:hypothetical protein
LVKDVKVAFALFQADDARFLEEEVGDGSADGLTSTTELDLKVFSLNRNRDDNKDDNRDDVSRPVIIIQN